MYDFYEEPRQLNMKKVIIIAVILILIIFSIIMLIARKISKPTETENTTGTAKTITFYSSDNSVSLELPTSFNLKQYKSDYLLELRSENDLDIFISKENALQNRSLSEIANADKTAYLTNFENYSNLSEIKELSVNNNLAYTYSFHYLDKNLNKAFYLQVVWLQIQDKYYTFDIEFPLDDLDFNVNIATSVLSTFKEL